MDSTEEPMRASSISFKRSSSLIKFKIFSPIRSLLELKSSLAELFTESKFLFSSIIISDSFIFFKIVSMVSLSLLISL